MYETFYGLAGSAFRATPDPCDNFRHDSYTAAAAQLREAIERGEGCVLLIGAAGTGKTTLINEIAAGYQGDGYFVGKVVNSQLDAEGLLQSIGFAFGLRADAFNKAELSTHLQEQLIGLGSQHRPVILIIEDAQDLAPDAWEELRSLCNLKAEYGSVVQILLSGQERLWERLLGPQFEQLRQAVGARCRLHPLTLAETRGYILRALQLVGWKGDPEISAGALRLLHAGTGGIPRLINLTVGRLLLHGSLIEAHRLEVQDVESVLAQLGMDHADGLLDTPCLPLASTPTWVQSLLPLDIRALQESETQKASSRRVPVFPSDSVEKGEGAKRYPRSRPQHQFGRYWKKIFSGPSAVVISVYLLFLVGIEVDRSLSTAIPEPAGGQGVGGAATVRIEPPAAQESDPSLTPAIPPMSGSRDPDASTLLDEHDKVGVQDPGPGAVGGAPTEAQTPPLGPQEASAETVPEEAEASLDIDNTAPPATGREGGRDQSMQEQNEVAVLLAKAERAMSENRLTVPAGDNAYAYYQKVLARDPDNTRARAGQGRILTRYRQLARQRLNRGDWRGAMRLASRGLQMSPGDRELRAIKRRATRNLVAKRERNGPQTAEAPTILRRIENWLRTGNTHDSPFLEH